MIAIDDKLISDDVIEERFVCDLTACKGVCCVEGDFGAPLEGDEPEMLEKVYEAVKPYLTPAGIKAIEEQGFYVKEEDGKRTPLIEGKACAYITKENGVILCGIDKAYREGKVDWQKPVSCHLYPIRVKKYKDYEAVNYERWEICKAACALGDKLKMPVYRFLKEALIRKYGESFYNALDAAAEYVKKKND